MVIKRSLTKQLMQQGGNVKIGLKRSNTTRGSTNNGSSKDYSTFLNQMKSFKKNVSLKSKQRSSKKKNRNNTNKTLEIIPQKILQPQKVQEQKKVQEQTKVQEQKKVQQPHKVQQPKRSLSKKKNNVKKSFTKNKLKRKGYKKLDPKRKNILVSMPNKVDSKNVEDIQKKIKDIKSKSKNEMIKELNKEGVQISGKDETIIRDIYLYSKLCGINIKK